MMSLSKFKALMLMAIVFLLGSIVGASLGTAFVSRKLASPSEPSRSHGREKMIEKFKSRLKLSPQQTAQMQTIVDETHKQFSALHETVKPQFDEIRNRMRARIRELLDEDQKREFEIMNREFDQRKAKEDSK